MRAALDAWWPALAQELRLYPDDVPRFSPRTWMSYVDWLKDKAWGR